MSRPCKSMRRGGALAVLLLLGACSSAPGGEKPRPATAAGWTGRAEVGEAIALLNKGDSKAARRRLAGVLKRQPGDTVAAKLLKQIDTAPETLLGTTNFAYSTRPQDTMSSLADRFLGDPLMFYALARYNGIDAPGTLAAGRTLRIPGRERREPAQVARPAPARPAPAVPPPSRTAAAPAEPPEPKAAPAAPATDPRRGAQLRAAGLEQLNRGAIDRAVALLAQASRADPANQLARRDLDRALRIQKAVQAQR